MNPYLICPRCGSHLDVHLSHCPVCGSFLKEQSIKDLTHSYPEADYQKISSTKNRQGFFVFLGITILLFVLLLFFELALPYWPLTWTIFSATLIFYVWVLISNTILSQLSLGSKLLLQTVAASIVLWSINNTFTPNMSWFTLYALPLLIVGNSISLLAVILFSIRQPRDDYRFLILFLLLNYAFTYVSFLEPQDFDTWMGYLTFITGTFIILGIMTLGRKSFIRFIKSWMHL